MPKIPNRDKWIKAKHKAEPDCIACSGTGKSSKGFPCRPCKGTGKRIKQ